MRRLVAVSLREGALNDVALLHGSELSTGSPFPERAALLHGSELSTGFPFLK